MILHLRADVCDARPPRELRMEGAQPPFEPRDARELQQELLGRFETRALLEKKHENRRIDF